MSDWHVRKGRLEFGWKQGKAIMNKHGRVFYEHCKLSGYSFSDLMSAGDLDDLKPHLTERQWSAWVNMATGKDGEDAREVVGDPRFPTYDDGDIF